MGLHKVLPDGGRGGRLLPRRSEVQGIHNDTPPEEAGVAHRHPEVRLGQTHRPPGHQPVRQEGREEQEQHRAVPKVQGGSGQVLLRRCKSAAGGEDEKISKANGSAGPGGMDEHRRGEPAAYQQGARLGPVPARPRHPPRRRGDVGDGWRPAGLSRVFLRQERPVGVHRFPNSLPPAGQGFGLLQNDAPGGESA